MLLMFEIKDAGLPFPRKGVTKMKVKVSEKQDTVRTTTSYVAG